MDKLKIVVSNKYGNSQVYSYNNPSMKEIMDSVVNSATLLGFSYVDIYLALKDKQDSIKNDFFGI